MNESQLKAILTMLVLQILPSKRDGKLPEDAKTGFLYQVEQEEIPMDERILEAEKLAEKVMGRMG